jgi:hypothetical protein
VDIAGLLYLGIVLLVAFLPVILGRGSSPPRPEDSDSDDGPGGGPKRPRLSPTKPHGGVPLPDAEPSGVRLREHRRRSDRHSGRQRRRGREPERTPART